LRSRWSSVRHTSSNRSKRAWAMVSMTGWSGKAGATEAPPRSSRKPRKCGGFRGYAARCEPRGLAVLPDFRQEGRAQELLQIILGKQP
jgi:hypothetical protein